MQITPQGAGLALACVANIMAYVQMIRRNAYHAGTTNTRLAALEHTLNNGIADTVKSHGEAIAVLQAVQDVD